MCASRALVFGETLQTDAQPAVFGLGDEFFAAHGGEEAVLVDRLERVSQGHQAAVVGGPQAAVLEVVQQLRKAVPGNQTTDASTLVPGNQRDVERIHQITLPQMHCMVTTNTPDHPAPDALHGNYEYIR